MVDLESIFLFREEISVNLCDWSIIPRIYEVFTEAACDCKCLLATESRLHLGASSNTTGCRAITFISSTFSVIRSTLFKLEERRRSVNSSNKKNYLTRNVPRGQLLMFCSGWAFPLRKPSHFCEPVDIILYPFSSCCDRLPTEAAETAVVRALSGMINLWDAPWSHWLLFQI